MPNKRLYIWILFASIAISMGSLIIPSESPWFTIMTGLGCGGTASAIVAGLVEYSNWKAEKHKKAEVRASFLHSFYEEFEAGICGFVRLCYTLQAVRDPNRKMTWYDWCRLAYDSLDENADHVQYFIDSCTGFLDGIAQQAQKIENQKADMLTESILRPSDIEAVTTILGFHSFSGIESIRAERVSIDETANAQKFHCDLVHGVLERADVLHRANEMQVGSILYKALEMIGEDATQYPPQKIW